MAIPTETDQWVVESVSGANFDSLRLNRSVPVQAVGDDEVLLEIKAVSLNYRDLAIATVSHPITTSPPIMPGLI